MCVLCACYYACFVHVVHVVCVVMSCMLCACCVRAVWVVWVLCACCAVGHFTLAMIVIIFIIQALLSVTGNASDFKLFSSKLEQVML